MKTFMFIMSVICSIFFVISIANSELEGIVCFGVLNISCYVQYAHLDIKEKIDELKNK